MVRPRRDEQDVLINRIAAALSSREGLERWTLADVAPAAGLSPAGLIKRFGSRGGILRALSNRWIESIPDGPVDPCAAEEELRTWVAGRFAGNDPQGVAHGLVNLIDDLVDADLRDLLAKGWAKEIRYLALLITQLNLRNVRDPAAAAAVLFDALNGVMLRGAVQPDPFAANRTLDHLMEVWT